MIKRQGNITPIEVETYRHHFEIYKNPLPDLAITLSVPPEECLRRLKERNRDMESSVPLEYLADLHKVYSEKYERLGVKSINRFYPYTPEETATMIIEEAEKEYRDYNS